MTEAYNPLNRQALAESIEGALLRAPPLPIGSVGPILGAGVYAIYYSGPFDAYAPIAVRNSGGRLELPIYVGKAIPPGARKGGMSFDASKGSALATRLRKHAASIREATNLDIADFSYRHLVLEDIWIPLGESILIQNFQPAWNRVVDGFGNNPPGKGRAGQVRSSWDTLHPGRAASSMLPVGPITEAVVRQRIADHFLGKPVPAIAGQDDSDDE